jgi:hypothetical protein
MSRIESMWIRNCSEAEKLEDDFAAAAADGILSEREQTALRLALRRLTSRCDEAAHVVALSCAYLNGGEQARSKYHSQVRKRERLNQSAGYRTLDEGRAADTQSSG